MASVVNELTAQVYWAQVPEWVLLSPVSDRAVRLYGLLARRAGAGGTCFPSRRWLADAMRCSTASVDRALEELVDAGAVRKEPQFRDKRQTVNLYTILAMSARVTTPLLTGEAPPLLTGDEQKESHREESQEPLAAAPRERKTDPLFEAVCQTCGIDWTRPLTSSARGRINKAVKELRDAGVTPDLVPSAGKAYRRKFPNAELTPTALAANWATLAAEVKPAKKAWSETNWCQQCGQDADDIYHGELCDAYQRYN